MLAEGDGTQGSVLLRRYVTEVIKPGGNGGIRCWSAEITRWWGGPGAKGAPHTQLRNLVCDTEALNRMIHLAIMIAVWMYNGRLMRWLGVNCVKMMARRRRCNLNDGDTNNDCPARNSSARKAAYYR